MNTAWDAVVVGAGPAGLAAATLLAEHRARTVLVDEQPALGGQIYRGVERAQTSPALQDALGPDYARGAELVARFRASGATYLPRCAVWQITPQREVWVSAGGGSQRLTAPVVILATGAMERPVPVPGWTLPGVMSAGGVQILLKTAALAPADGLVLAGSGPLLYLLAWQLLRAGTPPSAILDTTTRANEFAALRHLPEALGPQGRSDLAKGLALKRALRGKRVKTFRRVTDIRIEGPDRARSVTCLSRQRRVRVPASLVALHEGVVPQTHATNALGCEHTWHDVQRAFRPVLDRWGNTSVPGILVAGDAGGIGGARAAEHAGRLAAWEALRQLGPYVVPQREAKAAADWAALAAHTAIRPFLDRLYAPRAEILRPADDVVVCRCEEVTAGQIRDVVRRGCQGPNQAKSFLRAGMGPCQGRMCGATVCEIIAAERGVAVPAVGSYRIRPPLKPVTVGELAALPVPDLA